MLVITGIFENERFIPDIPVSIPQNKKVTITINDETDVNLELKKAADFLYNDYKNDEELIIFTCLDYEDFYEPRWALAC